MRQRITTLALMTVMTAASLSAASAIGNGAENARVSVRVPKRVVIETTASDASVRLSFFQSGSEAVIVRQSGDESRTGPVSRSMQAGWTTIEEPVAADSNQSTVTYDIWQF